MSKKTENIHSSINKLKELQAQLSEFNKTSGERVLQDIEFNMGQELKNLSFWIDSLYSYNGKSTSYAKKQASKENGKKGGRPPKEITVARRRLAELNELLPQLEHEFDMTDDSDKRTALEQQIETYRTEKITLEIKLNE